MKADPERLWRSDLPADQAAMRLHPPTRARRRRADRAGRVRHAGTWDVFGRHLRVTNLDKVLSRP